MDGMATSEDTAESDVDARIQAHLERTQQDFHLLCLRDTLLEVSAEGFVSWVEHRVGRFSFLGGGSDTVPDRGGGLSVRIWHHSKAEFDIAQPHFVLSAMPMGQDKCLLTGYFAPRALNFDPDPFWDVDVTQGTDALYADYRDIVAGALRVFGRGAECTLPPTWRRTTSEVPALPEPSTQPGTGQADATDPRQDWLPPKGAHARQRWVSAWRTIVEMRNEKRDVADWGDDSEPTQADYRDRLRDRNTWSPSERTIRKIIRAGEAGLLSA